VEVLSGTLTGTLHGDLIIINYDILSSRLKDLLERKPKVLIVDECHYIRNDDALRTKAVKKLARRIPYRIAFTGTPIINKPIEAFNTINLVEPGIAGSLFEYGIRYCGAKHSGYSWNFNGASNTDELHNRLVQSIMIRRVKKDVLEDLPEKIRAFTPFELTNELEYRRAEADFISFVHQMKGAEAAERASNAKAFASIEGLKQLAVKGKLPQAIEWINNFLEGDGKLVVFVTHKFVIDTLMNNFQKISVKVDGSVSMKDRQNAVDVFQSNPEVRLFFGNIEAAGVGLTLTASSNVVFLELPWAPSILDQAEDRCHRIGQRESVMIHYLLANNTIEERIAHILDRKRKIVDSVLDGKVTETESLLTELIREYAKITN
jgi:SNF2 family DNA or RNA helicase